MSELGQEGNAEVRIGRHLDLPGKAKLDSRVLQLQAEQIS